VFLLRQLFGRFAFGEAEIGNAILGH